MGEPARAADFIGVPYLFRGRTPSGWDCWGCVRHCRAELFGLESPDWSEAYALRDGAHPVHLAEVTARLISERLAAWRPVPPGPGAVALLSVFNRPAHVGLMISEVDMLHAFGRAETCIERVDGPRWRDRLIGFYDG